MTESSKEKTPQEIFSNSFVEYLYRKLLETKDVGSYLEEDFSFDKVEYSPRGVYEIEEKNIELIIPEGNDKKDFENTQLVYSAYKDLSPVKASDHRFWTYLTHITFRRYMQSRWPLKHAKDKANLIIDRYFLRSPNIRTLTHNGISRLWWFGYLTYREDRGDKWELTRTLLSLQDLPTSLFERSLGSNYNIRTGVLDFFLMYPELVKSKTVQKMIRDLNLIGGVRNLAFLSAKEIEQILTRVRTK